MAEVRFENSTLNETKQSVLKTDHGSLSNQNENSRSLQSNSALYLDEPVLELGEHYVVKRSDDTWCKLNLSNK